MQRAFHFTAEEEEENDNRERAEDFGAKKNQCVGICVAQQTTQLRTKDAKKAARKNTVRRLKVRLERNDWRCELSGVKLQPDCFSIDHIVPLVKGGEHVYENMQIVHPIVNTMKGTLGMAEFIEWCRLVADQHSSEGNV